jgi:hypothetical protein
MKEPRGHLVMDDEVRRVVISVIVAGDIHALLIKDLNVSH